MTALHPEDDLSVEQLVAALTNAVLTDKGLLKR